METLIVAFSRPTRTKITNFLSQLIRWWQGGTSYSHVLLIETLDEYKKDLVLQASHGKVHAIALQEFLKENTITDRFFIKTTKEDHVRAVAYAIDNLQKPYGFEQLFEVVIFKWFGIRFRENGNSEFICSELVARALPQIFEASDLSTPLDIYERLSELAEDECVDAVRAKF